MPKRLTETAVVSQASGRSEQDFCFPSPAVCLTGAEDARELLSERRRVCRPPKAERRFAGSGQRRIGGRGTGLSRSTTTAEQVYAARTRYVAVKLSGKLFAKAVAMTAVRFTKRLTRREDAEIGVGSHSVAQRRASRCCASLAKPTHEHFVSVFGFCPTLCPIPVISPPNPPLLSSKSAGKRLRRQPHTLVIFMSFNLV